MKIKSFFNRSIEGAMASARQELGADAMLMNSRKSPPEARHLGEYEVVFATDSDTVAPAFPVGSVTERRPSADPLAADVADLKREIEGMRRALTRTAFAPPQWLSTAPDLSDAYAVLTANEVTPELARRIVQGAEARSGGSKLRVARAMPHIASPGFPKALVDEIETHVTTESSLGRPDAGTKIVALAGPPGSGKTTTLVKLAINYGLARRRPSLLLSMDTHRVAAAEQLRSYASILGVAFQVLETVSALAQAIEEHRNKELIFIDTPGLAAGELEDSTGLARFLSGRPDIDTHLVLSSSVKPADLTRMVDSYSVFQPRKLLFTRLDETQSFGPILNEASRTGKPLSFFTSGQRIPEDMEEVTAGRLSSLILSGHASRARTAA